MAFFLIFAKSTHGEPNPIISPTPSQIVTKEDVEKAIIAKALQLHIDSVLLVKIARCESNLRIDAKNKISTASGIFQFLDSTFKSQFQKYYQISLNMALKNDPIIQIDLAAQMIRDGGLSHWSSSQNCWR